MSEDVQVDIAKVLEATQARLDRATREAIMLEALVNQQQEEIVMLRKKIDEIGDTDGDK